MFSLINRLRVGGRVLQVLTVSASIVVVAAIAGASPGGIDASSGASAGEEVSLSTSLDATPTASPSPEVSASPTPDAPSDSATPTAEPSDDAGENHGTYVSRVAKCVPPGPGHGEAVREMAQTHDDEAAKADEICSRYESSSPAPDDEVGDDSPGRGSSKDKNTSERSGSRGNGGKKGKSGGR
ncbi:MAG: hypothetical protein DCC49_10215 [Acidobacteria bacterium]|nr:MAG: hypothetical protein DCC49_10215 [Acidobacteriota bacterium]